MLMTAPIATFRLPDEAATARLGAALAAVLAPRDVIVLSGPLGAGKTSLARSIIQSMTGAAEAPSPTFALVTPYEGPDFDLWHFDLYRLENPDEADELGLEEACAEGACLIEWGERIADRLPPEALLLRIDPDEKKDDARFVRCWGSAPWKTRLNTLNAKAIS